MGHRLIEVDLPVDVETAWQDYVYPRCWARWAPHLSGVDYRFAALTAGTSGTVHGPFGLPVPFTILSVDEPRWDWRVHVGPLRLTMTHDLHPIATGCRATLVMRGPTPILAVYAPMARYALSRLGTSGRPAQ